MYRLIRAHFDSTFLAILGCELMAKTNLTGDETQKNISFLDGLHQRSIFFPAANILLSITAFLGNSLILVALRKETSLHPPSKFLYRCLATADLLVGLVSQPLYVTWWISRTLSTTLSRYASDAAFITSAALCGVSLLTSTAISVERLLTLLLGLRYKQIVTLKRVCVTVTIGWVFSFSAALCFILDNRISLWYGYTTIPSCLLISIASYTKIFRTLAHHQAQVQDQNQQRLSQVNILNMARYRKAVYSALWVQSALVVCYLPYFIKGIVINQRKSYSLHLDVLKETAILLVFFNSTLNPFLYCWKISGVRQAVKQTIRQALCCPWS